MATFDYNITEHIGDIPTDHDNLVIELNRISYNGATPKFDLRSWKTVGKGEEKERRMYKGITLNSIQLLQLRDILNNYFKDTAEAPTEDKSEAK
jgi:hypothetical protein